MENNNEYDEEEWQQVYNIKDCPINRKDGEIKFRTAAKLVKIDKGQGLGKDAKYFQTYGGGPEGGFIITYHKEDFFTLPYYSIMTIKREWFEKWKVGNIYDYASPKDFTFKIEKGFLFVKFCSHIFFF